jgi:hypothetical protein
MNAQSLNRRTLGRYCWRAIVVAGSLSAPHVAFCEPESTAVRLTAPAAPMKQNDSAVVNVAGVIDLVRGASVPGACPLLDAQLEQIRTHASEARAAADSARARLVREHLRFTEYPAALWHASLDQEALEGRRDELHAARGDISALEDELIAAGCDAGEGSGSQSGPVVAVDVRLELPAKYLLPLERALVAGAMPLRPSARL